MMTPKLSPTPSVPQSFQIPPLPHLPFSGPFLLFCPSSSSSSLEVSRRTFSAFSATTLTLLIPSPFCFSRAKSSALAAVEFFKIDNSGGVKALDLRQGDGVAPADGDRVSIHYYGRLAAKQGWRFDSTYDHKDELGDSIPFSFTVGSDKVISGISAAVKSMKVGGHSEGNYPTITGISEHIARTHTP